MILSNAPMSAFAKMRIQRHRAEARAQREAACPDCGQVHSETHGDVKIEAMRLPPGLGAALAAALGGAQGVTMPPGDDEPKGGLH